MNIKRAKQEIANTLKAYLAKDELGNYLIPPVRQRPVLLMGPPGIGKTQIMEQIAAENGVGLVAYTITHHTRQSAIGLPFIEKKNYGGELCAVTEYTMSEILASVYDLMEKTGIKEGILFLDEINCVSETLAPMMLQFLQNKSFGNRKLPEGWLIAAAGNPAEYNRSVREFDVVTLDRVKRIDVEEDFSVWKEYAVSKGLHGAVISYLDIKKDNFYKIEQTQDGLSFVTARGWEDLSEMIFAYEKLGLPVDKAVCGQYLQMPAVARDFAGYLALYYKYQKSYHVDEIIKGTWHGITEKEFAGAPFDEKLSVMGLIYSRLSFLASSARRTDELCERLYSDLKEYKAKEEGGCGNIESMRSKRLAALKREAAAGRLMKPERDMLMREINRLEDYSAAVRNGGAADFADSMEILKDAFSDDKKKLDEAAAEAASAFDNAFRFLEAAAPDSQEMVIFVTEITSGKDSSWFVETNGCDAYFRNNRRLLFDDTRKRILDKIEG